MLLLLLSKRVQPRALHTVAKVRPHALVVHVHVPGLRDLMASISRHPSVQEMGPDVSRRER